ncbi:hypothetical protein BGW80DRAFT_1379027 [Lactifluus volemus]|nr:hypothetical protein BGW80DRAFT_1379027 [Lactifluus volemus]
MLIFLSLLVLVNLCTLRRTQSGIFKQQLLKFWMSSLRCQVQCIPVVVVQSICIRIVVKEDLNNFQISFFRCYV